MVAARQSLPIYWPLLNYDAADSTDVSNFSLLSIVYTVGPLLLTWVNSGKKSFPAAGELGGKIMSMNDFDNNYSINVVYIKQYL